MKIVFEKDDLMEIFKEYLEKKGTRVRGKVMELHVAGGRRGNAGKATATITLSDPQKPALSPSGDPLGTDPSTSLATPLEGAQEALEDTSDEETRDLFG